MDDEGYEIKEEAPGTSKLKDGKDRDRVDKDRDRDRDRRDKADKRTKQDHKRRHEDEDEEMTGDGEDRTSNASSRSGSTRSNHNQALRLEKAPETSKPPAMAAGAKAKPAPRRRPVRRGRVTKRRRSSARRPGPRRGAPRRTTRYAPRRRAYAPRKSSIDTIFTRMSSSTRRSDSPGCNYCGHHCCGRRFVLHSQKWERRELVRRVVRMIANREKTGPPFSISARASRVLPMEMLKPKMVPRAKAILAEKSIQEGSCSKMLSPLLLKTSLPMDEGDPEIAEPEMHLRVTPEMIYQSLRELTMWRAYVALANIIEHVSTHWPVNPNIQELAIEMEDKLDVALKVGIVDMVPVNDQPHWCLPCALMQKRSKHLSKSHVTRFWLLYGDTMKPIDKKKDDKNQPQDGSAASRQERILKFLRINPFAIDV